MKEPVENFNINEDAKSLLQKQQKILELLRNLKQEKLNITFYFVYILKTYKFDLLS